MQRGSRSALLTKLANICARNRAHDPLVERISNWSSSEWTQLAATSVAGRKSCASWSTAVESA